MLAQLLEEAGILAYLQSDFSAARPLLEQALKSAYKTRERLLVAHIQHSLSNVLMNLGKFERVASLLAECLVSARAEQDKWLIAMALNNLAEVVRLRGDYDQAEAMFEEGLALLTELDNKAFIPILMDGLGTIAQYKGQFERALELHQTCLQLACEMDHQRVLALALEKLAGVAGSAGRAAQAARLLGAAEQLRESIGVPVETIDRADRDHYVSLARSGLTPDAFGEAWAQGRALPLEQAIAEALDLRSLSWGKTDPSRREC
jgi:tetratricopeptide (TPR) repeat protein